MEIYVLNKEIDILGVITVYESILWNSKLHEPGTFKAAFIFSEKMNRLLNLGNIIYKTDEAEAAVITRKYLSLNKLGEETIVIQGYMVSRYLNRRIIWNKMIMSGTPEDLMRKMVYEQVINPSDPDRRIPFIELGEAKGYGGQMDKQVTYDNLQETLTDIAKTYEMGYFLRMDMKRKMFVFEVYKGEDRTITSADPCVFSRDYGNILAQEYSEDETNHRNVCLVGGSGEDEDRILTVSGAAAGIDRYEMFYNASGLSERNVTKTEYIRQLEQRGQEKLTAYHTVNAFESKINQYKAMEYALGDYVTCTDSKWNVTVDTQIKEIEKGFSKEENSVVVTFGDEAPTLIKLIKAKE